MDIQLSGNSLHRAFMLHKVGWLDQFISVSALPRALIKCFADAFWVKKAPPLILHSSLHGNLNSAGIVRFVGFIDHVFGIDQKNHAAGTIEIQQGEHEPL